MSGSQQITIEEALALAEREVEQGGYEVALQIYQAILAHDPSHPVAQQGAQLLLQMLSSSSLNQPLSDLTEQAQIDYLVDLFHAGQLAEAEQGCRIVLQSHPNALMVYNILGVVLQTAGRNAEAVDAYSEAIQRQPDFAEAYSNRGGALKAMGRIEEALESLDQAIDINPEFVDAHYNRGVALQMMGHSLDAVESFDRALQYGPDAVIYCDRGNALKELGRLEEAVASYQLALQLNPGFAMAYYNCGSTLKALGKLDEAVFSFEQALHYQPDDPASYNNLGNTLRQQGDLERAVSCYRQALELSPEYADAHNNLGSALQEMGALEQALEQFKRAIAINPESAAAYNNLGALQKELGRLSEGVESCDRALQLRPGYAEAYYNRGIILSLQGDLEASVASFDRAIEIQPDYATAYSNRNLVLNYMSQLTPQAVYRKHLDFEQFSRPPVERVWAAHTSRLPGRRLKIGYLSPDFRIHSVAYFFEPLLTAHNRERVELYGYYNHTTEDGMTQRIREKMDHWRSIFGMGDQAVVEQVWADGIDILVDLAGHTAKNRLPLFAYRPAPVQISWLGYPNTTGLSAIDYRITDVLADPPGEADRLHSEKLLRLPAGFLCYQGDESTVVEAQLPCQAQGHITFGSFNNVAKVTPKVVESWAEVMKRVPGSRLLLKSKGLEHEEIRQHYLALFAQQGIGGEQLDLYGMLPSRADHLALYGQVDIGLDPFPYNGTTTTCEALWMGVPVVTMVGDRHAARVGASLMTYATLPELIAADLDGYIALAVQLAGNRDQLAQLRIEMRGRMVRSSLCDAVAFADNMENLFEQVWQTYVEG